MRHGAFDVLPDVERTPGGVLRPPVHKALVVGSGMADGPIELRYDVVHPTLSDPKQYVGIEVVIVLQPAGVTTGNTAAGRKIVVDAKGRNAELHPRFDAVHRVIEHLDEGVDVVATPVGEVVEAIAVGGIGGRIGNG